MKNKTSPKPADPTPDMRPEYNFTHGVRGKHYQAMQAGYTIRIHKADGTIVEKRVEGRGTVTLAPDVREYFPTSQEVNHALRTLIALVPPKRKAAAPKKTQRPKRTEGRGKSRSAQSV